MLPYYNVTSSARNCVWKRILEGFVQFRTGRFLTMDCLQTLANHFEHAAETQVADEATNQTTEPGRRDESCNDDTR